MTPISSVFMLLVDLKMDYDLLKKISQAGHTRISVYEEIDVLISVLRTPGDVKKQRTKRVKRIVDILLAKQCILLDPRGPH